MRHLQTDSEKCAYFITVRYVHDKKTRNTFQSSCLTKDRIINGYNTPDTVVRNRKAKQCHEKIQNSSILSWYLPYCLCGLLVLPKSQFYFATDYSFLNINQKSISVLDRCKMTKSAFGKKLIHHNKNYKTTMTVIEKYEVETATTYHIQAAG